VIYIQEAHPSDFWQLEDNLEDNVIFASPKGYEERVNLAGTCMAKLGIRFPALIDEFNNPTEIAYTGWPDRLYVIDREGRIAHKSAAGPFGFKPRQVEEALERILAQ
jgi:type I thyroxine 5'-deiodinase